MLTHSINRSICLTNLLFLLASTSLAVEPTQPVKAKAPLKSAQYVSWPASPAPGFGDTAKKWGSDTFPYFEAPKTNSQVDFEAWGSKWIDNVRNEAIIRKSMFYPKNPGGQSCAQFYGAFKIVPISPFEVEVVCFAGKKPRTITHELKYRFVVKWQPQDCADDSKVKSFFAKPGARTIQALDGFVSDFKKCFPNTYPVAPSVRDRNIILKSVELSREKLKEISTKPEHKDLADWLAGESPGQGTDEPCNPLTENCSAMRIKGASSDGKAETSDPTSAK